jgi:hypothetical protein
MAITDKTRKVLWAKSGNRCALCRHRLVVDETDLDDESVVGEECHICAQTPNGPRYESTLSVENIDHLDNLILLCSTHHKLIDDQIETYSASIIHALKANHEKWVEEKLKDKEAIPPIRLRRFKQNIPQRLNLVSSGKELMALASNCVAAYHDYSDDLSASEIEMIGGFFQNVRDYMDIWDDIEPIGQVRASMEIGNCIKELATNGFLIFAASEAQRLEGGINEPSNWNVLHLTIVRPNDPRVHFQTANIDTLKENKNSGLPHE